MRSGFKMYASDMVEISPGATVLCGVVHGPLAHDKFCFINTKARLGLLFNIFNNLIKTVLLTLSALSIRLNCLYLSNVDNKLDLCI